MLWRTLQGVLFLLLVGAGCDGWNMDRMARKFYPEPTLVPSEIFIVVRTNQVSVTGIGADRKLVVYFEDWRLRCTTTDDGKIRTTNRVQNLYISNR